MTVLDDFKLDGMICVITGGTGLLGIEHANAVSEAGGTPILLDIKPDLDVVRDRMRTKNALVLQADITDEQSLLDAKTDILRHYPYVNGLINNAANNKNGSPESRLESFPTLSWDKDIDVGLKGAFLCAKVFGAHMAQARHGVIINVASDLGLIAPDQRIYRKEGVAEDKQPVKPITYSVVKHGLIGMTKYLATYWANDGIRVNAICPGGVFNDHEPQFVKKLSGLIPMGRMAEKDEYKAAVVFLLSPASSYMTGASLVIDGGRTCW